MTAYERFQKIPSRQKVALAVLVAAVVVGVYYALFYAPLSEEKGQLESRRENLRSEKREYEAKRQDYLNIRSQVGRLLEKQKENLRILPKKDEIATFLDSIHAQADLSGLDVKAFEPKAEEPQDFYAKVPVALSVTGTFHRLTKFFRNVGQMKRIVNIEDLQIRMPKAVDKQILVESKFVAMTFRALERQTGAPAQPGAAR
jgi:type IV pilus assembly protein PilO